jgi:hypothetical protein
MDQSQSHYPNKLYTYGKCNQNQPRSFLFTLQINKQLLRVLCYNIHPIT